MYKTAHNIVLNCQLQRYEIKLKTEKLKAENFFVFRAAFYTTPFSDSLGVVFVVDYLKNNSNEVERSRSMQVDELVVVAEYNTAVEAEMAKSILACAGIDAQIENEYMTTLYPGVIRARLVVDESDYRQAKTLLRIRE